MFLCQGSIIRARILLFFIMQYTAKTFPCNVLSMFDYETGQAETRCCRLSSIFYFRFKGSDQCNQIQSMYYINKTMNFIQSHMSRLVGKPTMWFPNRSDTNRAVQVQKIARSLKCRMKEGEGFYYPCSENKGADQLRGYREAGLRLCFRICRLLVFS